MNIIKSKIAVLTASVFMGLMLFAGFADCSQHNLTVQAKLDNNPRAGILVSVIAFPGNDEFGKPVSEASDIKTTDSSGLAYFTVFSTYNYQVMVSTQNSWPTIKHQIENPSYATYIDAPSYDRQVFKDLHSDYSLPGRLKLEITNVTPGNLYMVDIMDKISWEPVASGSVKSTSSVGYANIFNIPLHEYDN
jgi:hypothetical protein